MTLAARRPGVPSSGISTSKGRRCIAMAALVVCVNRSLWRPLYRLAQTRYKLEG
jgi:ABC-type anion transport system duplicated permease subunit